MLTLLLALAFINPTHAQDPLHYSGTPPPYIAQSDAYFFWFWFFAIFLGVVIVCCLVYGTQYWGGWHTVHHGTWVERDADGKVIKRITFHGDDVSVDAAAESYAGHGAHAHGVRTPYDFDV